jgi:hypothetical protein
MGLFGLRFAMIPWKKLIFFIFAAYMVFWIFVGLFSVKSARFLYRKDGYIFAEIESRYAREASGVSCGVKSNFFGVYPDGSGWNSRGEAYGNRNIDKYGVDYGEYTFNKKQIIRISDDGKKSPTGKIYCALHQRNFDFFIPTSNEFEITLNGNA